MRASVLLFKYVTVLALFELNVFGCVCVGMDDSRAPMCICWNLPLLCL